MAQAGTRKWKLLAGVVLALVIAAGWAWARREALQAWYWVHQLAKASAIDRDPLALRVAELGEAAVPFLLDCLNGSDDAVCANARSALDKLGARWGTGDARTATLLRQIGAQWPRLSVVGRRSVLEAAAGWVRALPEEGVPDADVVPAAGDLLAAATKDDASVQAAGLALCDCLATLPGTAEAREPTRELVRACLKAESVEMRLRAIQTSLRPGMDLMEQVAVLLSDPAVEVRRAAIAAVGPPDRAVPDETLLPCLHDADPEVRQRCKEALTDQRGLKPIHLKLGGLLTHPNFLVRVQVLDELRELQRQEDENNVKNPVDAGVWMSRLSHDPMPSVRAAAACAMAQAGRDACKRRLGEMARDDPSPTVCYLADYYLKQVRVGAEE